MVDTRIYNFESDDEDHINGYELSDLSDVFSDDEDEPSDSKKVDLLVENTVSSNIETLTKATNQSLSLDDIPYDRDLKWMNVPTSSRIKSNTIAPSRFLKQVQSIAVENSKEMEVLDKHYSDMDVLKRNHDNKTLFELPTPVRGDKTRGSSRRKDRERKPRERSRNNRGKGPEGNDDPDFYRDKSNENGRTLYVNKPTPTANEQQNKSKTNSIQTSSMGGQFSDHKPSQGGYSGQNSTIYRLNPDSNDRNQGYVAKSYTAQKPARGAQQHNGRERQSRQERASSKQLYSPHTNTAEIVANNLPKAQPNQPSNSTAVAKLNAFASEWKPPNAP